MNKLMDAADLEGLTAHVEQLTAIRTLLETQKVYADHLSDYWGRLWEYSFLIEVAGASKAMCVLDVGGTGTIFSYYLCLRGCQVWTVDIAEYKVMQADFVARQFPQFSGIKNLWVDGQDLSVFQDGTFDRVFSVCVIEHLSSRTAQAKMMREMVRVLVTGGILGLTYDVLFEPLRGQTPWSANEMGPFANPEEVHQFLIQPLAGQAVIHGNNDLFHPAKEPRERQPDTYGSIGSLFLRKVSNG